MRSHLAHRHNCDNVDERFQNHPTSVDVNVIVELFLSLQCQQFNSIVMLGYGEQDFWVTCKDLASTLCRPRQSFKSGVDCCLPLLAVSGSTQTAAGISLIVR